MRVSLPSGTYTDPAKLTDFWMRLDQRLAGLPGVESAALVSGLAPMRPPNMNDTDIEGFVATKDGPIQNVDYYQSAGKDYFATMGIRLMDGRVFDARDTQDAPNVAVINKTMALTFWPKQNPIGRRIRPGGGPDWATVVGVVDDVKNAGLDRPAGTELYLPYAQKPGQGYPSMYVVLRARSGTSRSFARTVREQIGEIDPSVATADVRMMEDVLSGAQARPRFLTLLLTLFSLVALAIATVGIYGVISYSVARRRKEFGLRMVLGAQGRDILGLVMKQGAGIIAAGGVVGLMLAFALTRLMGSLLFGIAATDILTYSSVTALLFGVALLACYVPAKRATRVDPLQTLRYE
jgi:predicted permease